MVSLKTHHQHQTYQTIHRLFRPILTKEKHLPKLQRWVDKYTWGRIAPSLRCSKRLWEILSISMSVELISTTLRFCLSLFFFDVRYSTRSWWDSLTNKPSQNDHGKNIWQGLNKHYWDLNLGTRTHIPHARNNHKSN